MDNTQPQPLPTTEWNKLLGTMLGAAFLASVDAFVKWAEAYQPTPPAPPPPPPRPRYRPAPQPSSVDVRPSRLFLTSDLLLAAAILSVQIDSSPEEIRRGLRFKMIATGAHPDHGGNSIEALKLIAARDLLLEYAKVRSINAHAGGAP